MIIHDYTTQLCGDYFTIIRIPIKQPGFNGKEEGFLNVAQMKTVPLDPKNL